MFQLNADQRRVLDGVVDGFDGGVRFQRIVGPAGTGKTTMLMAVVDAMGGRLFDRHHPAGGVAVLAPTNKAASILRQKGLTNATTCHSAVSTPSITSPAQLEMLEEAIVKAQTDEDLEAVLRLEELYRDAARLRFRQRPGTTFCNASLLVVDEAGMVSGEVADWVRDLRVPILAIGDPYQLPPVNDKRPSSGFLYDLKDPDVPTFELSVVERQGAGSGILRLATMARAGTPLPPAGRVGDDVVILDLSLPKHAHYWTNYRGHLFREGYQFITHTNYTRRCLINEARRALHGYETGTPPRANERYIAVQTTRTRDVMNADAVRLSGIRFDERLVHAKVEVLSNPDAFINGWTVASPIYRGHFEDTLREVWGTRERSRDEDIEDGWLQLDWAYAMTAHKMQGDEADDVVVVVEPGVTPAWMYTALTRARRRLYLVRMET